MRMPASASMKLLLIGHGYLGKALARVFREAAWEVIPVSRSGTDGCFACDVGNPAAVNTLPPADFIVHCAASGHGGPAAYRHVHVDGCRNLANRFPGVPLLFTSSTSVYGQTDGSVVTEESPTLPDRETSRLLLEAERITLAAGGVVARLAGIYGPCRSVILQKFLAGEAVIEEDGHRFLNQIHRDDAARAIFHLATLPNARSAVFNVCDSTPLSQLATYLKLSRIFKRQLPPTGPRNPNRKRGWTHKHVSNTKLIATGWQPEFPSFLAAAPAIAGTL